MIRVLLRTQKDRLEIEVKGHQIKENAKDSLACNSMSILTQNLQESLIRLVSENHYSLESTNGLARVVRDEKLTSEEMKKREELLVQSFLIGTSQVVKLHPSHLSVEVKS